MLVDHADVQIKRVFRGTDFNTFSVDKNLTLIGIVNTRKHVHQCRFPAAVFSEQRQDFTFSQSEIDIMIGNDLSEPLGDISKFNGVFQERHPFRQKLEIFLYFYPSFYQIECSL